MSEPVGAMAGRVWLGDGAGPSFPSQEQEEAAVLGALARDRDHHVVVSVAVQVAGPDTAGRSRLRLPGAVGGVDALPAQEHLNPLRLGTVVDEDQVGISIPVHVTAGHVPGAAGGDQSRTVGIETVGAAPVDVGREVHLGRDLLRSRLHPLIGEDQVRIPVGVQIAGHHTRRPAGGQFGASNARIPVAATPVDVRRADTRVVVDVVAEDQIGIAVLVQVRNRRPAAAEGGEPGDLIGSVHQAVDHLRQGPFPPEFGQKGARTVGAAPVDERVHHTHVVVGVAQDQVHVPVPVQVPLIDDLDGPFPGNVEVRA